MLIFEEVALKLLWFLYSFLNRPLRRPVKTSERKMGSPSGLFISRSRRSSLRFKEAGDPENVFKACHFSSQSELV